MNEFLTSKEVMELLHIGRTTLWKYIKSGRLKPRQIMRKYLFLRKEIDELLAIK